MVSCFYPHSTGNEDDGAAAPDDAGRSAQDAAGGGAGVLKGDLGMAGQMSDGEDAARLFQISRRLVSHNALLHRIAAGG